MSCVLFQFAESFIFCDGVPEWWRFDVSHSTKRSIHREAGEVLRSRNRFGA